MTSGLTDSSTIIRDVAVSEMLTYRRCRHIGDVAIVRRDPMAEHQDGQSRAAWTAVTILLIASFLMCLAVVVKSWPMAIVGMVLVVAGVAAGKILAMAGFGQTKPERSRASTDTR